LENKKCNGNGKSREVVALVTKIYVVRKVNNPPSCIKEVHDVT
jgi:hypothetical protein